MLYWTQELAPPIQEFQLLGEHNLPTSSLYRAHCKWFSRPERNHRDLTAQYQDQPTPLLLLTAADKTLALPFLQLPFR